MEPFLTVGLLKLMPRALDNRPWSIADLQFRRALATQPHQDPRRVDPVEGGYFSGHLHRVVTLQTLKRLNKKHSVIKFAFGSAIAVNTFAFVKKLLPHGGWPSPRAALREHLVDPGIDLSGADNFEDFWGGAKQEERVKTQQTPHA